MKTNDGKEINEAIHELIHSPNGGSFTIGSTRIYVSGTLRKFPLPEFAPEPEPEPDNKSLPHDLELEYPLNDWLI